jgi:hypothetical protein
MTTYLTRDCDCSVVRFGGGKRPKACTHGNRFQTEAELSRKDGSTLNPGRGFAASDAQREKVKLLVCLGCGREVDPDDGQSLWTIDPAHLLPRSSGGCDDPLCVIPLCRHVPTGKGCHRDYDRYELDLHPMLARGGYEAELAHAMSHGLSPLELVREVTGEFWVPKSEFEVAQARVVELEAAVAP